MEHDAGVQGGPYTVLHSLIPLADFKAILGTTRIPEEKHVQHLEMKLREEASGILNWLLERTARWKREQLKTPTAILNATDEYRGEMDVIGNFIRERCEQIPGVSIKARELFKCYQEWCDDHNEHAVSERFLGLRLKELGLEQRRMNDGRYWQGIQIKN